MTILSHLDPRRLNAILETVERHGETSPESWQADVANMIGDMANEIRQTIQNHGYIGLNDDRLRIVETVLLWYFLQGNPEQAKQLE